MNARRDILFKKMPRHERNNFWENYANYLDSCISLAEFAAPIEYPKFKSQFDLLFKAKKFLPFLNYLRRNVPGCFI